MKDHKTPGQMAQDATAEENQKPRSTEAEVLPTEDAQSGYTDYGKAALEGQEGISTKEDAPKAGKSAAEDRSFKERIFKPIIWPILTLVVICIITSTLLGVTNEATAPIIAENEAATAEAARREVLPQADSFTEIVLDEVPSGITSMYEADNGAGYVIEAYGKGYGGRVPVMVGFNAEGVISGVVFLENDETPGLGKQLNTDEAFAAQFEGMGDGRISPGDVDAIANATLSTNAAVAGINAAIELYDQVVGGGQAAGPTPEETRQSLLPNATAITEITVSAEGITEAYAGDDGSFILYAQAPGFATAPVTVAVALDADGVILGVSLDMSTQSEGYGQELEFDQEYLDSFIGRTDGNVDAVADVTFSSAAVSEAVNLAVAALDAAKEAV